MKRIIVLLLVTLLFACVPTPEEDAVVNKNDGVLQQAVYATPLPEQRYEAPDALHLDAFGSDSYRIEVDAEVIVPDTLRYPVVEIAQNPLSIEQARDYMRRLTFGEPIYTYENEVPQTRADILKRITSIQEALTNPEEHYAHLNEAERQRAVEELQTDLEMWQEAYRNAPDEFAPTEIDIDRIAYDPYGQITGEVHAASERDRGIFITVTDSSIEYNNMLDWEDGVAFDFDYTSDFTDLRGVTISKDEAIRKAEAFLESVGITGFAVSYVAAGYDDGPFENAGYTEMQQSYVIWFTPSIQGVTTTYRNDFYDYDLWGEPEALDERQYAPLMWYEYIRMQVRDDGVEFLYWANPSKMTATLNENVALLPFDEIVDRFVQQIQYHSTPIQSDRSQEIKRRTVHIDRIVLGMMQVRKKNYPDIIQMIPTWTFFGTAEIEYKEPFRDPRTGEQRTVETVEIPAYSYLILNAIDGSEINPKFGY